MFKSKTIRNTSLYDVFSAANGYIRQKLSVASETHLLDSAGDYHGTQYEKYVYESDGIGTKITSSHITNQTVISKKGTAAVTVASGELQISAGWVTEIELSDGTLYRCEEQQGTTAFDASGNSNHGELISNITHATKKDITLINYTNEYGYTNNSGIIIPRIVNSDLDALGNTCEFIGKVGADVKLVNSNCVLSNGVSVTGTFNFSCIGLSITSKEGTATITLDTTTNKITIGAGTLYNLVLSNGYHFPIAEGLGTKSYRVLDYEKYITWTNISWTTQNEYHYNINNGFTDDNGAKLPLKGLIKVEDEPWTWLNQGHYDTWKNNWFLPSNNGTLLKGDVADYAAVTDIKLASKSLTTDFTDVLLSKFPNLEYLWVNANPIKIVDISSLHKLIDIRVWATSITDLDLTNCIYTTYIDAGFSLINDLDLSNCFNLKTFKANNNNLLTLSFSNSPLLINVSIHANKLDDLVNSELLIDLDGHGLSNGNFRSSIFGGGELTAAGKIAVDNLRAKNWGVLGVGY